MATILVVDDRPINRQLLTTLLGYSGHRFLEAGDGAEALKLTRAERPDLVITDILMPTMDGFEFVQSLRADPAIAKTPVIFYTATYRAREAYTLARACGVSVVIPKPSDPEYLLSAVNAVLGAPTSSSASPPSLLSVPSGAHEPPNQVVNKIFEHLAGLQGLMQQLVPILEIGLKEVEGADSLLWAGDKLLQSQSDMAEICFKLTALIELGLNAAPERRPEELLELFCRRKSCPTGTTFSAARDLITAKYAAIGVLTNDGQTLRHFVTKGIDAETEARIGAPSPREGVWASLLEEKRPRRMRDLNGDPQRVGLPASHPPIHSFLGVPIATQTHVHGWLYLADKLSAAEFSEFDEKMAALLASQIAGAYENVWLYDELQRHAVQLQLEVVERKQAEKALQLQLMRTNLLNQIARAIAARYDLKSLLQRLEESMPLDFSTVHSYDPQSMTFMTLACGQLAAELGIEEGVTAAVEPLVCARGETIYVRDAATERATLPPGLARREIRSVVVAPLIVEELRVLCVGRGGVDAFSDVEREFLQMVGEHVALAARHAQLYQNLQTAYNELRTTQQTVFQQERLRALGQMASGVAHDFNNALTPIAGYSALLLHRPERLDDKEQVKRCLQIINIAAQDAENVVNRLREFYRERDGDEILYRVDLNPLVEQAISLTQPRWEAVAQASGIDIRIETDLQPTPPVAGVESELREALMNLIFNAVDAMPQGGTITIRTWAEKEKEDGRCAAPSPDALPSVVLEVSDTGVGMIEEVRQRRLEPFFTTKGERGTGLGLSMVYGVIRRHEGTLEIESEPGRGATLRIRLPLHTPAMKAVPKTAPALERLLHILVVEDNPRTCEILTEFLTLDGHTFETAIDGREGWEKFDPNRFDLVITDRAMPQMSGDLLTAAIKQVAPNKPVIMLTGFGNLMKASNEQPAGVDVLVSKPVTLGALRQALAQALGFSPG